jgi:three-Cys-motif partner protein
MVLETAIQEPELRDRLVCTFNDKDKDNTQDLQRAINEIPGIETMKYKPEVRSQEVGEEMVKLFGSTNLVPTLFFVDPWGYKGLSLKLVNSVLKDWGCDCVFFFNYNRINMGLTNDSVKEHMDALFGEERADMLRVKMDSIETGERESAIIEELCLALKEMGGEYVLPFRFKNENGTRTSHHLIFVCKHFRGYEIMKEIMAKESTENHKGVPSFEYNPATRRQPLLSGFLRPADELPGMLLDDFAGRVLTMRDIYVHHSVGRPFLSKNYKDALLRLEEEGKIEVEKHKKGTFADKVVARFPGKVG